VSTSVNVRSGDYSEPVTINFTYMNAGYITLGYGSLLTFTDVDTDGMYDELTVQRYSTTGKDDTFGNTGIGSPYTIVLTQWGEETDEVNGAGQTGTTTPDESDVGQIGTAPDASDAGQQGTAPDENGDSQTGTTPDVSAAGQTGTMLNASDAGQQGTAPDVNDESQKGATSGVSGTIPNENGAGQTGTTPDESAADQTGMTPDASAAEQSGTTPDVSDTGTEQSDETTMIAAVNTGDSVNVIYFFTLAVSSCALLAQFVKKYHS
jgi:hypothetical protein